MENIGGQLERFKNLGAQSSNAKFKAAKRKIAIEDIEKIIGKSSTWKWFSFPIYIPTEWIESWKAPLISHYGNKSEKLFELLKESRNGHSNDTK